MKHNFTLSIISHGHRDHICALLLDLSALNRHDFKVILTLNIPEELPLDLALLPYDVTIINNTAPKGFGSNHNAAFKECLSKYFIILNPDIRLIDDPFSALLAYFDDTANTICAPLVVNQLGELEDSARFFPTPLFLGKKLIYKIFKLKLKPDHLPENERALLPDWIAGMFIAVPHETYQQIGGFNEHYHMYYEDVDFCARAQLAGQTIAVIKDAKVIHEAQHDSHRKIKYLIWHLQSIFKFFMSKSYRQLRLSRSQKKCS